MDETLSSVFAQENGTTGEVLVFDGGSTDGTLDILRHMPGVWRTLKAYPTAGRPTPSIKVLPE